MKKLLIAILAITAFTLASYLQYWTLRNTKVPRPINSPSSLPVDTSGNLRDTTQ